MVIYRLTCRITGKRYIGATRQALHLRLAGHRNASRAGGMKGMNLIAEAIRVHGWDAFDVEVLAHARSFPELMEMEKAAIILHRTMHPTGYNQLAGGGGWLDRPRATGRPAWNKGVPHTDEAKALMSASHAGAKNFRARAVSCDGVIFQTLTACRLAHGWSHAQAYRRIQRGKIAYLEPGRPGNYGRPEGGTASLEARQKMSEARSGAKHYRARSIEVDGVVYPSIKDAEGVSGYSRMQLKTRLKDGRARYLTASRYIQ